MFLTKMAKKDNNHNMKPINSILTVFLYHKLIFSQLMSITKMGLSAQRCVLIIWILNFNLERMETISGTFISLGHL